MTRPFHAPAVLLLALAGCGPDATDEDTIEAVLRRLDAAPPDYLSMNRDAFSTVMRERIEELQELLALLEEELAVSLDGDQDALTELHARLLDTGAESDAWPEIRAEAVDETRRVYGEARELWEERAG